MTTRKLYLAVALFVVSVPGVHYYRQVVADRADALTVSADKTVEKQVSGSDTWSDSTDNADASYAEATPEPSSFVALLGGLGGVAYLIKRKRA